MSNLLFLVERFALLDQEHFADGGDLHRLHRDLQRPHRDEGRVRGVRRHGQQGTGQLKL